MKKGIKVLIGFVLAIALAGSGFWLVHRFIESKEQQANFRELAESMLLEKPKAPVKKDPDFNILGSILDDPMSSRKGDTSEPSGPEVLHDIAALKEKNAECAGWIRVPGTDIDYPFMWTPEDPERYLRRDFYGNYSDYGVPFLDHRCDLDSDNLILYGHNMFDGTMFTDLLWFREQAYREDHSQIILETPEGAREYRVIAVCQANSVESKLYRHINFTDAAGNLGLLTIKAGQGIKNSNDIARQMIEKGTCSFRELQYALSTGKLSKIKPYGIRLSTGRKVLGNTWIDLAVSMLRECASIPECKEKMLKESETGSLGRSPYLASNPSIMSRPKKIMDGLYFNAAADAVSMFDRLVKTMDKVGFDYSSIDIMFRPTMSRYKVLPAEYADTVPFEWAYRFANGRRPTILKLPDGREIHVKSWKKVIETILEDCCKDPEHLNKLRDMAGQLSTRRGTIILSKDQEQIKTPIKLPDGLFAEGSGSSEKRLSATYRTGHLTRD